MVATSDSSRGVRPLRWEVDRIAVEAHEIIELDLRDEISTGDTRMLHGVADDAARLLGAHGADPRTRLGLDQETNAEQVQAAAQREALQWRPCWEVVHQRARKDGVRGGRTAQESKG